MHNLRPTFEHYYPENAIGPGTGNLQGQCAVFAQYFIEMPKVGDTIETKKAACKAQGILRKDIKEFLPGDVLVLDIGTKAGHIAVVSSTDQVRLNLSESNYREDKRVHHDRWMIASSPQIYGIFRGKLKVPVIDPEPPATFPVELQVRILMNNQPVWPSLLHQMAELQDWYDVASNKKLRLIVNYKDTHFSNWPTVYTSGGVGPLVEIIKEDWYDANILPLFPEAHVLAFVMKKNDFGGGVNLPGVLEVGYCYPPHQIGNAKPPIKTFMALDENTDYPPEHPSLSGLSKYIAHEMSHGLYQLCAKDSFPAGTDLTHNHFYGLDGNAIRPEDIFLDLDLEKLSRIIN